MGECGVIMDKFIYTTKRDGKIALWISVKENASTRMLPYQQNIWDLSEKELTPNVLEALESAISIGMEIGMSYIRQTATRTYKSDILEKQG